MAATLSSPVCAILASCSSSSSSSSSSPSPKARNLSLNLNLNLASSSFSLSHFRHNSCSSRPWLSRKLLTVQATILQDNEEKVVVEESPPPQTSLYDQVNKGSEEEPSQSSSSSTLERLIIKFEQFVNILLTDSVIRILDTLYRDRDYARFFVLETIARVPYFGIGGNSWWFDRFLAQHIAIFYYFMTVFMYAISPRMAYHFSECVESHAFSTYDKFVKARGEELKKLPAPEIAVKYYTGDDMYLFDEFQTSRPPNSRRPKIENLYDVFLNIRDDEAEHCKTMKACQTHGNLRSPHSLLEDKLEDAGACALPQADCEGVVDCLKKSVSTPTPQK